MVLLVAALPPEPGGPRVDLPAPTPTPTVPELYALVAPSVVTVETKEQGGHTGLGSAVIVDDLGDVLTAFHVIASANEIRVTFADGTVVQAKLLAAIPDKDIAALRPLAHPSGLVVATLGNPGSLRIGDEAIVVGNPFGLTRSLSTGVISGLGRSIQPSGLDKPLTGLIQFDAAVNPGNSGGPLFDRDGDVVGIVTGLANPNGQASFSGIGFAVTIDVAGGALGVPPD